MTKLAQPIKHSQDFQNIARNAKRWTGSCFVLMARKSDDVAAPFRFGLTASRKVGNAVVRNRAKRRLREMVRAAAAEAAVRGAPFAGYDIVIIARTCTATADYASLQNDLSRGLRHLGLMP